MNKTNNRGRGRPKKEVAPEEKQMNYMRGLSTLVNKACDEWLRKRGVGPQDWRSKKKESFKKRQAS
jgi:hypothetical protein